MKLHLFHTVFAFVFGCLALQAATVTPSNHYLTRPVRVSSFSKIVNNTSIDVVYTVGKQNIEIYASDNLIPFISVTVADDVLKINYSESMNISGKHNSEIRVSAPAVTGFVANSAGDYKMNGPVVHKDSNLKFTLNSAGDLVAGLIRGKSVSMNTNSAGDIKVSEVQAENLEALANSAGDIEIKKISAKDNVNIRTNSAGDIEIDDIAAGSTVELSANSAGDIKVKAVSAEVLSVRTNSAGDADINGIAATKVKANTSSAGDIKLAGNCEQAILNCWNPNVIDAKNLKANDVNVTVNSTGLIYCSPLNSLTGSIRSKGKVKYTGKPAIVNVTGTGLSQL